MFIALVSIIKVGGAPTGGHKANRPPKPETAEVECVFYPLPMMWEALVRDRTIIL